MSRPALALLASLLLYPGAAPAQVRASEPATISQTVDGTRLTVSYSRPRDRRRDSLFGKVVHWGEVWTPGANMATTLEAGKDIKLNGRPVPKGKYSVWMVVRQTGDWTFVLDPRHELFHMAHPDSTAVQIRFPIRVEQRPYVEVLTWSFPVVKNSGATLAMQWGTTYVPLEVEVEPSYTLAFPENQARPYLGRYEWTWKMPGLPVDSTRPVSFVITYEQGSLTGRWDPPLFPEWERFALIRIKDDWFIPAFLEPSGEILEVAKEFVLEFKLVNGRAATLESRGPDDSIVATAVRKG